MKRNGAGIGSNPIHIIYANRLKADQKLCSIWHTVLSFVVISHENCQ